MIRGRLGEYQWMARIRRERPGVGKIRTGPVRAEEEQARGLHEPNRRGQDRSGEARGGQDPARVGDEQ